VVASARRRSRQAFKPGLGTGLETQATRAGRHGVRRAAQNAQALLVEIVKRQTRGVGGMRKAFFNHPGRVQIHHRVLLGATHAVIVKAGGDVGVSVQRQLCDSVGAEQQLICYQIRSYQRLSIMGWRPKMHEIMGFQRPRAQAILKVGLAKA
jgi:hypothetical protein